MPSLFASLKNALAYVILSVMLMSTYFFLIETWLNLSDDEAKRNDLAPGGYHVKSFAGLTRVGGLAKIARKTIFQSLKFTSSFTFDHSSLEFVMITLSLSNKSTNFFCIYRPPP